MKSVKDRTLTDMKGAAVIAIESQFRGEPLQRTPKFDKAETMNDPRNDEVLHTHLAAWTRANSTKVSAGTTLVALRGAVRELTLVVQDAERVNRRAEEALENAKDDVRRRYLKLGLELPPAFHDSSCGCPDCTPIPESRHE